MINQIDNYKEYLEANADEYLCKQYTIHYRYKGVSTEKAFDLSSYGWKIQFNNSKRALGICKFSTRTITLSRYFFNETTGHSHDRLTNTILHEIAHAIDFLIRKKSNHDSFWKSIARQIGCDGKRCASDSFENQISKYSLICPSCNKHSPCHRRPAGIKACSICINKDFEALRLKRYRHKYVEYVLDKYKLEVKQNY